MEISLILSNFNEEINETVEINNVDNKWCFEYLDNENNKCNMRVYEDGICFFRQCVDHELELHLRDEGYAKITTPEGIIKLSAKVVDFNKNNDILVMRYIVEDQEREIKIFYRS